MKTDFMSKVAHKTEYPAKRLSSRVAVALRETAWLEAPVRWQNDRLTWQGFTPRPADLHLAQLRLVKASKRIRGLDWLDRRQFNLQIAFRLQNLAVVPQTASELTEWLLAEAVCLDSLPFSAAAKLVTLQAAAIKPLQEFINSPVWPEAQQLAALVLGALCAKLPETRLPHSFQIPPALKPFFGWGMQHGLPNDPAFYVRLLVAPEGAELAQRYQSATQHRKPYRPDHTYFRSWLFEKTLNPAQLVTLAEASRPIPALLEDIHQKLEAKISFAYYYGRRFKEQQRVFLEDFEKFQQAFVQFIHDFTEQFHDSYLLKLALLHTQVMATMLDERNMTCYWQMALLNSLQNTFKLNAELARSYLELLIEQHSFFWKPARLKAEPTRGDMDNWYTKAFSDVNNMLRLLEEGQNPAYIREIVQLDILIPVSAKRYPHPEQLRDLLWFIRQLKLQDYAYLLPRLGELVCLFNPDELKKYWRPLGELLKRLPDEEPDSIRFTQLSNLIEHLSRNRADLHTELASFLRHAPTWLTWVRRFTCHTSSQGRLVDLLVQFDRYHPTTATARLEIVIAEIETASKAQKLADYKAKAASGNQDDSAATIFHDYQLAEINLLALTLADNDLVIYKAIFATCLRQGLEEAELVEAACPLIKKLPAVKAILSRGLLHNYQDCLKIIIQLGEISRLQASRLTPLSEVGGSFARENFPPAWQELVEKYPALETLSAGYLHARWLSGESLEVPAGVQRELELATKLHKELDFLEQAAPDKPALQKRLENLQARLADSARLDRQMFEAAEQKMTLLHNLASLQAIRAQIKKCYQVQLATLAPPANSDLVIDENLLNALQIFAGINRNRPLLLRLLRARARGEHDFRANLPGNRQFIADLTAQGKNAEVWLAENRQTFRLAQQQIQVYMETDPFHVLQMGNYFDTCLAATGFNAFSTVTNACDFNKRVIFARDENGKVIGRKLIAITKKWQLVGFRNYAGLESTKLNTALHRIFNQYCRDLAARCNMELSDDTNDCCEVAHLVTTEWYDDGAVDWSDPQPENSSPPAKENPTTNLKKLPPPENSSNSATQELVEVGL